MYNTYNEKSAESSFPDHVYSFSIFKYFEENTNCLINCNKCKKGRIKIFK